MKTLLLIFSSIALTCTSHAQNHNIFGIFPTVNIGHEINDHWKIETFTFLAINPIETNLYPSKTSILYNELDLTFSLNKKFSTTLSYTYERLNPFRSDFRNENRLWIQLQLLSKISKIELKNRLRYDFRLIHNGSNSDVSFEPRLRYLLGAKTNICKEEKGWSINAYNEVFFNTFSTSQFIYAENWGYFGVRKKLNDHFSLELGYLNIGWVRDSQKNWLLQHYVQPIMCVNL